MMQYMHISLYDEVTKLADGIAFRTDLCLDTFSTGSIMETLKMLASEYSYPIYSKTSVAHTLMARLLWLF